MSDATETVKKTDELEKGESKVVDITKNKPRKDLQFYKVFTLTYKTLTGEVLEGTFTVKRLTVGDTTRVAVRVAQLGGGYAVSDTAHMLNSMIAHLEVALVEKPSWFKADELYEMDIIAAVYSEVGKFEDSFRHPVEG
jgi:hypothetical protein